MKSLGRSGLLVLGVAGAALLCVEATASGPSEVIRQENERPGTTEWILTKTARGTRAPLYAPADEPYDRGWRRRREVEGFCSHTSIRAGQRLAVYVSTDPPAPYRVDIYRMGYYGGKGARLMRSLGPFEGVAQPTPEDGPRNVRESRWREAFSLDVPQDWVSGFEGAEQLLGARSYGVGFADWTCANPDHWAFAGTGMKKGDRVAQLVGWEYHGPPLADHEGLEVLSSGTVYGWSGEALEGTYATTLYPWKKGNLVFNAATCWWNLVLSKPPGFMNPPRRCFLADEPRIQSVTKNVLDRMIAVSPLGRGQP